ncbi:hypothetical protein ACQEVB_30655 [Pseudonocardia sp. CA-107938]|uniref:hypothetical protein n=1 Tax=Pseudonocardia sp. CA-107938 TaxID=3240021 RepID=UPI003D89F646
MTPQTTRGIGGFGVVVTVLGVGYGLAAIAGWAPSWGSVAQAVLHVGELAVVVALFGVIGAHRVGRAGLAAAAVGQVVLVVAELVYPADPGLGDVLFGIAPLLSGIGMIVAGVVAARLWHGWQRFLPLAVGIWIIVPTTPILIITGGPPAPLALAAVVVWDVLWAATGLLVVRSTATASVANA